MNAITPAQDFIAAEATIEKTVVSSPVVLASALAEVAKLIGPMKINQSSSSPDLNEFLRWIALAIGDIKYFTKEISAAGGLAEAGRKLANEFLKSKGMDIQLDGPGGPDDVFAAAYGLFEDSWRVAGEKYQYKSGKAGFALKADGNQMHFISSDTGGITVVIRGLNGDLVFLSQTEKVDARQVALASSVFYSSKDVMFQDRADYAGIVCPCVDFNIKPDIKWLIGATGTANDVAFRIAQAMMQAKFALHHQGYKAEVAVAVAVSRGFGPRVDTTGYYEFDPNKPLAIWLARQRAQLPHFAALVHPSDFKMPKMD